MVGISYSGFQSFYGKPHILFGGNSGRRPDAPVQKRKRKPPADLTAGRGAAGSPSAAAHLSGVSAGRRMFKIARFLGKKPLLPAAPCKKKPVCIRGITAPYAGMPFRRKNRLLRKAEYLLVAEYLRTWDSRKTGFPERISFARPRFRAKKLPEVGNFEFFLKFPKRY